MTPEFWRDRRVLVTGHTGFKGSWLTLWLKRLGAEVYGYSLAASTDPNLFELADVAQGITSVHGDVRDLAALTASMREFRPEVVVHLAAQSLVRASYRNPVETFEVNVMGTAHVLEAVRMVDGVGAVVVVTSDKCYENREWLWGYREIDPMGGHDPYSASKGCAELVTAAFRRSFSSGSDGGSAAVASARAGNVIGGGDWAEDRLVPDAMRAFLSGQPLVIRSPHAIRPWQHVLEPLAGYLTLAEHIWAEPERFACGWNFGPEDGDSRPVGQVVEQLGRSWGEGARWELAAGEHPHEAGFLRLDCSRARELLGWFTRLRLDEALDWTVEWYRAFGAGEDLRKVTLDQISRYQSRI